MPPPRGAPPAASPTPSAAQTLSWRAVAAGLAARATEASPFPAFENIDSPTIYTPLNRAIVSIPATLFYGFAVGDLTGEESIGLTISDTGSGDELFKILVTNGDTETVDMPTPAIVAGLTLTWVAGVANPAGCVLWR